MQGEIHEMATSGRNGGKEDGNNGGNMRGGEGG